ncbi:molybdopterin molybdotransferase [Hasllibacter halocynthiae]|uniref:Molybdopterin molybdenumtransferase n=1 Tax=Hasllibacter halocynthiae TaxID=595589 RepID=A0A2T0X805_9RHOB|nr:molybdopterin molybdotransferase MoeA [Hasllibacter halocynthiae]PRY95057.1 molybdopterin molybdotransferase [Hasllibacter halocynthiae]
MIPFEEARRRLLALVAPLPSEPVPLDRAGGRALAEAVIARRDSPPFRASMMDGYAVSGDPAPGSRLRVVGEAAAGRRHSGPLGSGEAVRILTGAPVPDGADRVLIQEDVERDGHHVVPKRGADRASYVRPAGADFAAGARIEAGQVLSPALVALAAAFGAATLRCAARPEVAILSTGDELTPPGGDPGPDGIFASNAYGLAALVGAAGGRARILPIAADDPDLLAGAIRAGAGADVLVTSGGASVGDRDLVAPTLERLGARLDFHRIAMRPGKPVLAGTLGAQVVLGLPGNPVSAMICGRVFLVPMLRRMLHLPQDDEASGIALVAPLEANGPRTHFMRAVRQDGGVRALGNQDSGRLSPLARADLLIQRPPHDPARRVGDVARCLSIGL